MLKVEIERDQIRIGERFAVSLYRTLRVPDDGKPYPLPPGLGKFPVFRVDAYRARLPAEIRERGGAFVQMYQREALWLGFHAASWKPNAVLVAAGGINALTGTTDSACLSADPQNYLVCPNQPWLDGIRTHQGMVRQFVAMPLGLGYSIEAALTGSETAGGLRITVFEPKPGRFPDVPPPRRPDGPVRQAGLAAGGRLGLGAGGAIRQRIYPDPHGLASWDPDNTGCIDIHLVNSLQFRELTGLEAPPTPVDAQAYTEHGFPWFDLYDEAKGDLMASAALVAARTIAERERELGKHDEHGAGNQSFTVSQSQISTLKPGAADSGAPAGKKR